MAGSMGLLELLAGIPGFGGMVNRPGTPPFVPAAAGGQSRGLLSRQGGIGGLLGSLPDRLNTPTAQLGAMILANSGGQAGGIGQAVTGFSQQQRDNEKTQMQKRMFEMQLAEMQRRQTDEAAQRTAFKSAARPRLMEDDPQSPDGLSTLSRQAPSQMDVLSGAAGNLLAAGQPGPALDIYKTLGDLQPKATDDIKEYQMARAQGFKGTLLDFQMALRRSGATNVNVNGNDKFGAPPPGFYRPDPTRPDVAPQPGGTAQREIDEAARKDALRAESAAGQAANVLGTVESALGKVGRLTAGVGGTILERVPGSTARDLQSELETIKANLGFDRIQQMREQSPTGGALGSVAVQELNALQSTVASLDNRQSPPQLKKSLEKIKGHYERWANTVTAAQQGVQAPNGMTVFPNGSPAAAPSNDDPLGLR